MSTPIPSRRRSRLLAGGLLAIVLPVGPLTAQSVAVKEVVPDRIRLIAGERGADVGLRGAGLRAVAEAWVESRGRPVREVVARVRGVSAEEIRLELVAEGAAPSVQGTLVLVSRDGTRTPVPGLAIEVVAARAPVLPSFTPRRAATAPLAFTGLRFEPRAATTPSLFFVGLSFQPRRAATPSLVFTGPTFQPRRATTPALVFTGTRSPSQDNDS